MMIVTLASLPYVRLKIGWYYIPITNYNFRTEFHLLTNIVLEIQSCLPAKTVEVCNTCANLEYLINMHF